MTEGPWYKSVGLMKLVLPVSSLASLLVLGTAAFQENLSGQWQELQGRYKDLLVQTAGSQRTRPAHDRGAVGPPDASLPHLRDERLELPITRIHEGLKRIGEGEEKREEDEVTRSPSALSRFGSPP